MHVYTNTNEPLPKLKLDKKRFRVKHCPYHKDNKDGKFVPYVGFENKGYCHSCGETFSPELPKVEQRSERLQHPHNAPKPDKLDTTKKPYSFIPR